MRDANSYRRLRLVPTDTPMPVQQFIAHLRYRGRATATQRRRRITLDQLARYLAPRDLFEATVDDLESFLVQWDSAATRRAYRSDLRDFYGWAAARERITTDPADALESISEPVNEPSPLPREALMLLLATPEPVTRRMIWIAAFTGLRVSEIAALHTSDVDLAAATLRVGTSKGGHGRTVRIAPELAPELSGLEPGRLFPGATAEGVSARIKRRMVAVGLPDAHPHQLRHTFATNAGRHLNGNLVEIAAMLGHRSFHTTRRYVPLHLPTAERLAGLFDPEAA